MEGKQKSGKKTQITDFFVQKNGKKNEEMQKEDDQNLVLEELVPCNDFPQLEEFIDGLHSWKKLLSAYTTSPSFTKTYKYCKEEYASKKCYPPPNMIFNAFRLTPLNKLKVVIVGQDPYHQPGQAMGLCFSVPKAIKTPPSLKNMYKVLSTDPAIKNFKVPNHGDLTKWATQGVFMLNDILTVEDSKPASHKAADWGKFTDEVIKLINKECQGVVFLLWGLPAQKKAAKLDTTKHHIIKTSHPSPLGASSGFMTSKCFSKCNEYLKDIGKEPIDWNLD